MSASVWFEEVNIGLLKELKDHVRVRDANGVLVPLSDKGFMVRKPEEDFMFEVFPCVSIYNKDYKHDTKRYNPNPVVVEVDKEKNQVWLEDSAIPYNLTYQIDFWSKFQGDMDSMTMSWLKKHFRQFNLKVVDDGGKERTCNCLAKKGSITKSDLMLKGERLFHSIINLQIWVEIDDETRYNKPMVVSTSINSEQN